MLFCTQTGCDIYVKDLQHELITLNGEEKLLRNVMGTVSSAQLKNFGLSIKTFVNLLYH
jgi:hypothetical protein